MYRSNLNSRDKSGAVGAVVLIHAALFFALLHISGRFVLPGSQDAIQVFDVNAVPPPPPPPPRPVQRTKSHDKAGGSAPKNIRSEATEVLAPKPIVVTPPVQAIAAADVPRAGYAPTQGASDMRGPGTGAGGTGTGTGNGLGGDGPGSGDGGVATMASLVRGIAGRDYPSAVRARWPRGGVIYLRVRVEPDGHPSRCDVMRGFGDPSADQWSCALVMQLAYWRPALNVRGEPISAWYGYKQVDIGR